MAALAKSGFQSTEDGILYWFLGADDIANFLGPVASLEAVGPGEFLLRTTENKGYRVRIDALQLIDFRGFGGTIKPIPTAAFAEPPQPRWGFQKNNEGVFLSFGGTQDAERLGPILRIEHLQEDRYSLIRKNDRHSIRLTAESLADFARLGGTVANHTQAVSTAATSSPKTPAVQDEPRPRQPDSENGAISSVGGRFPLNWHGTGRPLKIGLYTIADPMLYWSKGPSAVEEASCIDVSLPVGQPVVEAVGAMGYWPEYRRISPGQRANYLAWLASGRKSDLQDIGYAFIYLYGLERRALLENQDINSITLEVIRLLKRYTFSGSFTGYLTRFLSYLIARTGLERLRKEWFEFIFQGILGTASEEILSLALAWHVKRQEPLSPVWAVRMARQHPRASQSVVVQRAAEQFQSLFSMKYRDRFGSGFTAQGSRRDRRIDYKPPANPSLLALRNGQSAFADSVAIPNVLGLQSQFLPLVKIWDECIEELKPVSRRLAAGSTADPRDVFDALPDELKGETEHPDKPQWDALAAEHTSEAGFVGVPICRLAGIHGVPERRKLTLKQSLSLAETAQWVGYCFEPDARITCRPYGWQDVVALFRPDTGEHLPRGQRYASAALIMELGTAVAAADGAVTELETGQIRQFLEGQFVMDHTEVRRLKQLEQVYLNCPPVLSGVAKGLRKSLSQDQRETLGRFLVGVAVANSEINQLTVKALRSAYRAMGLEVTDFARLLEELRPTAKPAGSSPAIADGGEPAPPEPTKLNQDLIRQIMADTSAVAGILSQVMEDEEVPCSANQLSAAVVPCEGATSSPPATFAGLPERFAPLLAELLLRDELQAEDFERLVRAKGLMPADAVSRINEWAEENLDEFLIEEGQPIIIHRELIRARV